ncbi:cytochrome P450 [Metarhizium guizhouense ARSEF 977]|uniref:Cytochrome P450 n=1 Tax=Metarhizium guizhouense (strain ARSEF 977) TaxID=1276136 RepID=A0A0B4HWI5_METGA|nr:cytochrome P450 [Metarhizium guizhouense ARSEF 977]
MLSAAIIPFAILAVSCGVFYLLVCLGGSAARKRALAHIPELRFEKDNTPDRYGNDTRSLLRIGYEKYLQYGVPFQMYNPIGELGNQVVLPMKYLDEVKRAPKSLFSFEVFSEKLFLLNYINAPRQTNAATHAVKFDLNRNLNNVINGLWTEAEASLKKTIPSPGWQSIPGGDLACSILTPVMSYILVGPSLCRNPEWLEIAAETTFSIIDASLDIRKKYTANWRWLARWQDGTAQRLGTIRKKALELIKPLYDERRQAINKNDSRSDSGSEMFHDTVYWILGQKRADTSLKAVVDQQLFLTLASIHNTAGMLQSLLFDWIAHPEYHAEITAEINETLAEFETSGSEWTLQRVARMRKLDSFMKESIRVNPIGFITGQRYAVKSHTFKDGFNLPAGTMFHFAADAVYHDPNIYPDPDKFDAYRFLRLRENVDPNQFHFAFVSDTNLSFGAGQHACPGRFLAAVVLKFALILLITRYEIKFSDGSTQKPPGLFVDNTMRPDPSAKLLIKALI